MSLWRVYLPEWLVVYTSDQLEVMGQEECRAVFAEKYAGRVRDEDWRVRNSGQFRPGRRVLELRLPNLQGEYKNQADAACHTLELGDQAVLAEYESLEERELTSYGQRMLPAGQAGAG